MALQAPTPVPLAPHAELERQERVAASLARLLAAPAAGCAPAEELEAQLSEIEQLRCVVHLSDLENCKSQQRAVAVSFAITHDAALREEELRLSEATESQRQQFFNDIHEKIKRRDFSSFAFQAPAFLSFWDAQCSARSEAASEAVARLRELEALTEPCMRQRLAACGQAIGSFAWAGLRGGEGGENAFAARLDALTMERADDLWLVAESWPAASPKSAGAAAAAAPRDLMLVVDLSGSMCEVLPLLQECLHETLARAREADRLCVIGFSSHPKVLCEWTQLQTLDARKVVRECVEAMSAHGGTRLVPALDLVGQQLRSRPEVSSTAGEGARSAAVVLLSDGDPEEPAEAISSAALKAFAQDPHVTVVSLSLGEESRPDLMALLAQSGRGASLYISGHSQLPSQLGRMWGILGGCDAEVTCGSVTEMFLVLEPAEGAEVIETERPPGGAVALSGEGGRQIVALRCGQHTAASQPRAHHRLAARLRLPEWLKAPVDNSTLQRPLLRATWVWCHGDTGAVHALSDTLRVVQVPSLLVEAQLGLPLRLVLSADAAGLEAFDREAFLRALAAALGVAREDLVLGRLSPGSIIADLRLLNHSGLDLQERLARALRPSGPRAAAKAEANPLEEGLSAAGHELREASLPGAAALRRALQWRLAGALEAAARGAPEAPAALAGVRVLAAGEAVQAFAGHPTLPEVAAEVAADAAAAAAAVEGAAAAGQELGRAAVHALEQQAHAHCQQVCPELMPAASAVRCYEVEEVRRAALSFEASAVLREAAPPPVALELAGEAEAKPGSIAVRVAVAEAAEGAAAVVALSVSAHCGDKAATTEVPIPSGSAGGGVLVQVPALEAGADHALVAAASNGRSWGPKCEPLLCRAPSSTASPTRPGRQSLRQALRRSASRHSLPRRGPCVEVLEGTATALGTLVLRWEVWPAAATEVRWSVSLRAEQPKDPDAAPVCLQGLADCTARFRGLLPSTAYCFSIAPEAAAEEEAEVEPAAPAAAGPLGLSIQGTAVVRRQAQQVPQGAEGVVVVPPYPPELLKELKANGRLRACGPGLFVAGGGGFGGARAF